MNIEQEIQNILDRNFTRGDNAKALKELLVLYNVVGQSEQLADDKSYQPCDGCNTSCKEWEIFFCKKLG